MGARMTFQDIDDVYEVLRSQSPTVRDLHELWEQRQPVPDALKPKGGGTVSATSQIPWLQQDIELASDFTRQALAKEEFLLVCDAARESLRLWPAANGAGRIDLVRVRVAYALALSRLGFTRKAREELEPCVDPGFQPVLGRKVKADILLQLGNILSEESHHATAKAVQLTTAEQALTFYRRSLELEPRRLETLVLIASTSMMLSETGSALREEARETAQHILTVAREREDTEGTRFQTTWARATAHAVLGDVDTAARRYADLEDMADATTARLAEARFTAQFLAEALGQPRDLFRGAFPPLQLIVFAGHRPDLQGQLPRFPTAAVPAALEALRAQLEAMRARVALVSASAGADLLLIEAMRERQGTVHLVLPWSQQEFLRSSVRPFEPPEAPVWEPRFERAVREAATIRELGQVYEPSSDVGWEYMIEVTAGIALHTARASRLDVQPLVLWDCLPGRDAGSTESFYSFWQQYLHIEPVIVAPPVLPRERRSPGSDGRRRRCEVPILHQEVKSMLFADIVGYSKLTEKVIPEFVQSFMERLSQLVATSPHAPCSVNTWGDAIYAVFDFARDAGLFALELSRMVQEGRPEWLAKGLFWEEQLPGGGEPIKHPLNIRIGLHTGPVVMHYDPVVRRLGFTGAHVNRAARIEPVAAPGEAYASEEFAAMAELSAEIERRRSQDADGGSGPGFVCEYAGSMPLAKGYPGRYRIYRVVPKRALALEELARAAHESYCAESRARGETAATNSSLLPWSELPEDLREANRSQVADIPNKLRLLGYELAPSHGLPPSEVTLTDAQVEDLARREHDRWMASRRRDGWTYAARRDNARKHHPLLIPWEELSEPEREKDRDTIRNLPRLVERAGLRLRRIGPS
jgi:class 3 adenylate cyclase